MIEYKNISVTFVNTGTFLSQNAPLQIPLSDAVVTFFNSKSVLTPNGPLLVCATVVFSGRYGGLI